MPFSSAPLRKEVKPLSPSRVLSIACFLLTRATKKKYADIYQLSEKAGGSDKYAWRKRASGQKLLNENIMVAKKSQL